MPISAHVNLLKKVKLFILMHAPATAKQQLAEWTIRLALGPVSGKAQYPIDQSFHFYNILPQRYVRRNQCNCAHRQALHRNMSRILTNALRHVIAPAFTTSYCVLSTSASFNSIADLLILGADRLVPVPDSDCISLRRSLSTGGTQQPGHNSGFDVSKA